MTLANVLILSSGRRVELLQGFRAALARYRSEGRVLAADLAPDLSAACALADAAFALPRVSAPEYGAALAALCREQEVGMVIPTIDTELAVLSTLREDFAARGTHLIVSSSALIANCRDKRRTGALFRSLDIDTPEIYPADAVHFPCFAKPYDGSSSVGARRVDRRDDLTDAERTDAKTMFMELVTGDAVREFTVDVYFDRDGALRAAVPRLRIETRAGEISKGVTRRGALHRWLWPRLTRLSGARGCITLQLFADEAKGFYRAIEINPRFGGGFPLSLAAGADYPGWLVQEYLLGRQPEFADVWQENLMMLRYDAKVLVHDYL